MLDENLDVIKKIGVREIVKNVKESRRKIGGIVLDGAATSSLIKLCDEYGIPYLAATNFTSVDGAAVKLVSL